MDEDNAAEDDGFLGAITLRTRALTGHVELCCERNRNSVAAEGAGLMARSREKPESKGIESARPWYRRSRSRNRTGVVEEGVFLNPAFN